MWPPTRDHEQGGHNYFVSHVGQTGALASEAGQGVRGVAWFQHQRRHSTVSMLAPVSTQQQGKTHNHGTYGYIAQRGTTDSSVYKTAGDKWPAPATRLKQTHLGAAVEKIGNKISIPLRS